MAHKQGTQAAWKLGYTNLKAYIPGISGWQTSGEKTESAETKKTEPEETKK